MYSPLLCEEVNKALHRHVPMNPHYEKWGPGRPSKEKIERRRLSQEWERENNPQLKRLLDALEAPGTPVTVEGEGPTRKITMKYIARTY